MEKEQKFCHECGEQINAKQVEWSQNIDNQEFTTLLICWFLGIFGIHRFYVGKTSSGIIQLLTLGGCGVWVFINLIIIALGNFTDSEGNLIKNK